MKRGAFFSLRVYAALGGVMFALTACDNMGHQRKAGDVGQSGRATPSPPRTPPPFTVERGSAAPGDPALTGLLDGQPVERSPVPVTRALLSAGRERFNIHCAICHGEDGYGTGIVVRRGFPAPPSYHDERLRRTPDGHFFDVITRGYGTMLPLASQLTPAERWAVIAYIRALQRSQHVALSELPSEDQAHFSSP
ncbi:MAG: hypothetical protein JWM32_794 [Verrucomicrobia bacterium]|nr:hypothetical protein [Verrucomicrobiota bacterium]